MIFLLLFCIFVVINGAPQGKCDRTLGEDCRQLENDPVIYRLKNGRNDGQIHRLESEDEIVRIDGKTYRSIKELHPLGGDRYQLAVRMELVDLRKEQPAGNKDHSWYAPDNQTSYPRLLFSPAYGWREVTPEEERRLGHIKPLSSRKRTVRAADLRKGIIEGKKKQAPGPAVEGAEIILEKADEVPEVPIELETTTAEPITEEPTEYPIEEPLEIPSDVEEETTVAPEASEATDEPGTTAATQDDTSAAPTEEAVAEEVVEEPSTTAEPLTTTTTSTPVTESVAEHDAHEAGDGIPYVDTSPGNAQFVQDGNLGAVVYSEGDSTTTPAPRLGQASFSARCDSCGNVHVKSAGGVSGLFWVLRAVPDDKHRAPQRVTLLDGTGLVFYGTPSLVHW